MNLDKLKATSQKKTAIALTRKRLEELQSFLKEHFGIQNPKCAANLYEEIREKCGDSIADQFIEVHEPYASENVSNSVSTVQKFYNFISQDPILGLVHSRRWPYIFDTAAYVTALAEIAECEGPFLDVGCHAGFHSLWLSFSLGMPGRGMDRASAAIRYARRKGKNLGLTPSVVTFDTEPITHQSHRSRYRLILCSDGPLSLTVADLKSASSLLADDGIFMWVGNYGGIEPAHLQEVLNAAELSLCLADVIGGWDVYEGKFWTKVAFVFTRGSGPPVGEELESEIEAAWNNGFSEYCNTKGRPSSEKLLSIFRCHATHGPRPEENV